MPDLLYPRSTKDLAQRRHDLALEIEEAFEQFSRAVFQEGALSTKDQAAYRRGCRPRDPMSLLHPRPCQGGKSGWSDP